MALDQQQSKKLGNKLCMFGLSEAEVQAFVVQLLKSGVKLPYASEIYNSYRA
jgi:hypothetical protein